MKRFWVSWYSMVEDPQTAYDYYLSGEEVGRRYIYCALLDSPDEAALWRALRAHFPDLEERFCDEKPEGWEPGDRFPAEGKRRTEIGMTATARAAFQPPAEG